MALKVAFVNFFRESNGRKVVKIEDIKDFKPLYPDHFDEDKTYEVRWPQKPTDNSFSTEGYFEAKILCLGVDFQDLCMEAKRLNLRVPKESSDLPKESLDGPNDKSKKSRNAKVSSRGRVLSSKADVPAQAPEAAPCPTKKKKKPSLVEEVRECRVKKIVTNYLDPAPSSGKHPSKKEALLARSKTRSKARTQDASPRKRHHTQGQPRNLHQEGSDEAQNSESLKEEMQLPRVGVKDSTQKGGDNSVESLPSSQQSPLKMKAMLSKGKARTIDGVHDMKSTAQDQPVVQSQQEMVVNTRNCDLPKAPLSKANRILGELPIPQNTARAFSTPQKQDVSVEDSNDMTMLTKKRKRLTNQKSYKFLDSTTDDESVSSTLVDSEDEINIHVTKIYSLETRVKEREKEVVELRAKHDEIKRKYEKLKKKFQAACEVNTRLKSGSMGLARESSTMSAEVASAPLPGPSQDVASAPRVASAILAKKYLFLQHASEEASDTDTGLKSKGHLQSWKKGTTSKRTIEADPMESGITGHETLSRMISKAFKGTCPLESDGAGKVHIGNNTYISKKLFDHKISQPSVSPSIALRDAAKNIYSEEELAQRSLTGGTPVKGDKSNKKQKMTPAKRESLFGLYRAKVIQTTNNEDKAFLDLSIRTKGRETLKDRMKEAARSLVKAKRAEAEKAEKAAKEALASQRAQDSDFEGGNSPHQDHDIESSDLDSEFETDLSN